MNITLTRFKGTAPKTEPRLLSPEYSQVSTNIRYDSGALLPIKEFEKVSAVPSDIDVYAIYKYKLSSTQDKWLFFDKNITCTKDPLYKTHDDRVVLSGVGAPRVLDNSIATTYDSITDANTYLLGIPVPTAPVMSVATTGTANFESRAYAIQYDRVWPDGKIDQGPFSAPAATADSKYYVDLTSNGSVQLASIPDAPAGCGITHITINRANSSTSDSDFYFSRTFNIVNAKAGSVSGVTWNSGTSTFTVVDSVNTEDLGPICANQDYIGPESTLSGITSVTGGMLAGFYDNYVCFSEPYQCHAWPDAYKVAIDSPIVGLGTFGEIVVVCTNSEPYIINLGDPANAIAFPIKEFAPCISAEGIVSYRDAVVYPSEAGFIRIDRMGVVTLTLNLADIHDMKDFDMHIVRAAGLGSYYYVLYTTSNSQVKTLILNMQDPELGFGACDKNIRCMYADFESATLYCAYTDELDSTWLGKYDSGDTYSSYVWKSKIFTTDDDTTNLSAARIRAEYTALPTNGIDYSDYTYAINEESYNESPINGYMAYAGEDGLTFYLYVDGNKMYEKRVLNKNPFRLPAGYIGTDIEVMLVGNIPVYKLDLATSIQELTE